MSKIIYVDMVADLFHSGHVNLLKRAKTHGDILLVGIHSDKDVQSYKRTPIIPMKDRITVVESCKYVDKVIPNAPLIISKQYIQKYNIDLVIHAHQPNDDCERSMYYIPILLNKFKRIDYTSGISTTQIIEKCKNS